MTSPVDLVAHAGNAPRPAVVISAFTMRRWDDLKAALTAVGSQSLVPAEVILAVDDNPELATRARTELTSKLPTLRVIEFKGGLSEARNLGVNQTTSAIVAFLDDDARPDPDWLEHLVLPFADPETMLSGGAIVAAWPAAGRPKWFPNEFLWVVGATYGGMDDSDKMRNPIGASMAVRRTAWEAVGGFKASIGLGAEVLFGCEETDISVRIRAAVAGARIVFAPRSVVHHAVSEERTSFRYFLSRCRLEGRSKAAFRRANGAGTLGPERRHAVVTIPRALLRYALALLQGDLSAAAQGAATCAGLIATLVSFAAQEIRMLAVKSGDKAETTSEEGPGGGSPGSGDSLRRTDAVPGSRQPEPGVPDAVGRL